MSQWYRRDWDDCESATRFHFADGLVHITSDRSGGLFWQIPTIQGRPITLDPKDHPWLDDCRRPPRSFNSEIVKQGFDQFIDVADYPYVSWRWKVDNSTIEEQLVDSNGKLKKGFDDFAGKIGISILKKGSNTIREVAYVWSSNLPESLMFKTETTIIPMLWKMEWRRFVVESGRESEGRWVSESRNLYEDFKRGYPGEEPGKILRILLQTDSDNTQSRTDAWYADIAFHKHPPGQ